jgi:hypothetical protein
MIFNLETILLNLVIKNNLIARLVKDGNEFFFIYTRKQFTNIIETYASSCGVQSLFMEKPRELSNDKIDFYLKDHVMGGDNSFNRDWYKLKNGGNAVAVLFNNDQFNSRFAIAELVNRKYFSISLGDSDSMHIGSYFTALYGNDNSTATINFFLKYFATALKKRRDEYPTFRRVPTTKKHTRPSYRERTKIPFILFRASYELESFEK